MQISSIFLLFISVTIISTLSINVSVYFAKKFSLLDKPSNRKLHKIPIPITGGIAIYISIFFSSIIFEINNDFLFLLLVSLPLLIFNFVDDVKEINYFYKIIFQSVIILILILNGFLLEKVRGLEFLTFYNLNYLLTFVCFFGLINAFNFIDGVDGLCSSVFLTLFSFTFILFGSIINNFYIITTLPVFIFLIYNLNLIKEKQLFLGDSGSIFLGLILSCVLIYFSQIDYLANSPIVCWLVAIPIFDLLFCFINRALKKSNPFKPDKSHLHHRLIYSGFSYLQIVFIFFLLNLFSLLIGLFITNYFIDYNYYFFILYFLIYYLLIIIHFNQN